MAIERWAPFGEAMSLSDAMNTLFRESFIRPSTLMEGNGGVSAFSLPLDVTETDDAFLVKASLPGIEPEKVQITVHGDVLTIHGECHREEEKKGERWHMRERRCGSFRRSVSLPMAVDSDKAAAQFEHGVLTLTLPKSEAAKPRQIKIGGKA